MCRELTFVTITRLILVTLKANPVNKIDFVFLNLSSELIIEFIQKFSLRLLSQAEIGSHMEIF